MQLLIFYSLLVVSLASGQHNAIDNRNISTIENPSNNRNMSGANRVTIHLAPTTNRLRIQCRLVELSTCSCHGSKPCELKLGDRKKDFQMANYLHKYKLFQPHLRCKTTEFIPMANRKIRRKKSMALIRFRGFASFCNAFDACDTSDESKLSNKIKPPKLRVVNENISKIKGRIDKSHHPNFLHCTVWIGGENTGKIFNYTSRVLRYKGRNIYKTVLRNLPRPYRIECNQIAFIRSGEEAFIEVNFKQKVDRNFANGFLFYKICLPKNIRMIETCQNDDYDDCLENWHTSMQVEKGKCNGPFSPIRSNNRQGYNNFNIRAHYGYRMIYSTSSQMTVD